jgi:hypothetical protein
MYLVMAINAANGSPQQMAADPTMAQCQYDAQHAAAASVRQDSTWFCLPAFVKGQQPHP